MHAQKNDYTTKQTSSENKYAMNLKVYGCHVVICLFILATFFSCRQAGGQDDNTQLKDSLRAKCEGYAIQLQSDSLRKVANDYLKITQPYSRDYFKAHHFLILADFNAHNYTDVLHNINRISAEPHFEEFPDLECRYQFTLARALQYSQRYDAAIAAFKKCLTYDSPTDSLRQYISVTMVNAMMQLMNTSLAAGKHAECATYFKSLIGNPTSLIRHYCLRDLYSISAYAIYMNDDTRLAVAIMDKALKTNYTQKNPIPQSLFRDYSYAAAIFGETSDRQAQTIELCQKALKIGYANSDVAGMEWLTEWFGTLCIQSGKIGQAIDLYHQSITISQKKGNAKGVIDSYNRLNELYLYMGMYELANSFSNLALDKIKQLKDKDPSFLGYSYLKKATTMLQMNRLDSALGYATKAEFFYHKLPYGNGSAAVDEIKGEILLKSKSPQTQQKGIECLTRVLNTKSDACSKADIYVKLAKGYIQLNEEHLGEAMLDSMYHALKSFSTPVYLPGAYQFALRHYLKKNNTAMIKRFATEYLHENDSVFNDEVAKKLSQFTIKYETEKKEQQLRITKYELKNNQLKLQLYIGLTVILIIVLISTILFIIYKKRIFNLHRQLTDSKLEELAEKLDMTQAQREKAEEELKRLLSNVSSQQMMEAITPEMYKHEGENRFRSRFNQLHPLFLSSLRSAAPNLTKREEILCMLIALQQNNEQMAEIFCIEKKSINMLRYRIRTKMHLERGDSLKDFITALME